MLPIVEIIRLEEDFDFGTFGALKVNKQVFWTTLEPSDEENEVNISSIPAQQYVCKRVKSPKYGDTFQIMNVPNRSHVLFHPGNIKDHTKGCVLIGQYWGRSGERRAVLNSKKAFKAFMKMLINYDEFHLTIREIY